MEGLLFNDKALNASGIWPLHASGCWVGRSRGGLLHIKMIIVFNLPLQGLHHKANPFPLSVQVNKSMMISGIVVLTVSTIYVLVIIGMWLLNNQPSIGETAGWRTMSLSVIRRSLLPRDGEWN